MNKFCLNDKNKILLMTALGSGVAALAAALAVTGPTIASASFTAFYRLLPPFAITSFLGVFARFGVNPALGVNPLLVYVVPEFDGRSFFGVAGLYVSVVVVVVVVVAVSLDG